jgi:hypothetical protein
VAAGNACNVGRHKRRSYAGVTLYRGLNYSFANTPALIVALRQTRYVTSRPSSWTADKRVAEEFAAKGTYGMVMAVTGVDAADVLFDATTLENAAFSAWRNEEQEIVLRPGSYAIRASYAVNMPPLPRVLAAMREIAAVKAALPALQFVMGARIFTIAPKARNTPWEIRLHLGTLTTAKVSVDLRRQPAGLPEWVAGRRTVFGVQEGTVPVDQITATARRLAKG